MHTKINISGIDKAKLLMAFYNAAKQTKDEEPYFPMTPKVAADLISCMPEHLLRFDVVYGRVLRVDITDDWMYNSSFDTLYGKGSCQRCVDSVRWMYMPVAA